MDYMKAKNKDILRDLCERMKTLAGQLYAMEKDAPKLAAELDIYYQELIDIERNTRNFVLYSLDKVGTQKGIMRAIASKENGKKGGRPPKAITEKRKRLADLNAFCDDFELKHTFKEMEQSDEYNAKSKEAQQIKSDLEQLTQEWQSKKHQK